jgi:hypothetical protein
MERIKAAEKRLYETEWEIEYQERRLREWQHTASRSFASLYAAPIVFTVLGLVAAVWGIFQIPVATMDNGGNWSAGPIIGGLFVAVLADVSIFDTKYTFRTAPEQIMEHETKLAEAQEKAVVGAANVRREKAEYERRRRLPDAWTAVAGLLAADTLRRIEQGDYEKDDLIAAELRAVVGTADAKTWKALEARVGTARTRLLRDASEAIGYANPQQ